MKGLIAKRYIKALAASVSQQELEEIALLLKKLADASSISKFREIIESPYIASERKMEFILKHLLDNVGSVRFVNFIKVLEEHRRLDLFGELYAEVSSYLAAFNKEYIAQLIVAESYEDSVLKEIESKFSKRLGVKLVLQQKILANAGIKLVVEDLGVEVSFSKEKFITDLRSHILRAF